MPLLSRRRPHAKMSESGMQEQQRPFEAVSSFHGPKAGYVFKLGPDGLGYYNDAAVKLIRSP